MTYQEALEVLGSISDTLRGLGMSEGAVAEYEEAVAELVKRIPAGTK